jgi:phosphate transport system permease protein
MHADTLPSECQNEPSAFAIAPPRARLAGPLRLGDPLFYGLTLVCAASIIVITGWLVYQLYVHSAQARHAFGWKFLVSGAWDPVAGEFGALPFIFGTAVTSVVALLIAAPLGIGTAIFLAEMAPRRLSNLLGFMVDLLAAVPSVIYGLLGIFLLVPLLSGTVVPAMQKVVGFLPLFSGPFYGVSLFSASLVLVIMVVPFIISISRAVMLAVPIEQREASFALGSTHWETVWKVVLPDARRGIYASVFLALARALGETMAVTMVIGNTPQIAKSLFAPGYTIAAVVANEFTEATGNLYLSALIELGLVLFGITVVINGLARLFVLATSRGLQHDG